MDCESRLVDQCKNQTAANSCQAGLGQSLCLPLPEKCDFAEALHLMRKGAAVARMDWNGKHQYIQIQHPTLGSKMTVPYIYMTIDFSVIGSSKNPVVVPWLASQTDLLADDWHIVAPK